MNPITTTQLENTQPMNLPSSITAPVPDITSFITTTPQMQEQQKGIKNLENTVYGKNGQGGLLNQYFTGLTSLGKRGATQIALEEQAGIPTLNKELVDIENQLRQTDLDFRRQREALQIEPGLTTAQRNSQLADVTRKQVSQLADLEVIRQARSNSLTNAQSLIDKKVELEFADRKANVDAIKFILDENKDRLTKEQEKLLTETYRREDRAFNLAKSNFEQLENEKIQLVRNAQANGADNGTMSAILGSKTLEEAYRNAGSFGMSIDDKIKRANYSKLLKELGGDTTVSEQDLTGIPSQDIAAIIKATGAKPNAKMSDAIGVIKGLEDLALRNTDGQFKGMAPGVRFPFLRGKTARTERQFNLGDINAINLKVQQWASGASLTKQQEKAVKKMVPDKNDSDEQAKRKINQLTDYMLGQVSSELSSQGIQSTKPTFSFFDSGLSDFQIDESGNIVIPGDLSNEDFFNQF